MYCLLARAAMAYKVCSGSPDDRWDTGLERHVPFSCAVSGEMGARERQSRNDGEVIVLIVLPRLGVQGAARIAGARADLC